MRNFTPARILSAAILLISTLSLNAQHDRFAYAITDVNKDGAGWNALRKLDLETGKYSDVLFNGTDVKAIAFDAGSKKQLSLQPDEKYGTLMESPFGTGVAAAAYDKQHNRLYFTPMFVDQLRYIDLKTMKVYYITNLPFTKFGNMHNDEAKIITRMVIAPDGYGYAISNDGNTFIRFTTNKKVKIEQLGSLVDDPSNNGISIHNRCSSFGGDMISDDQGNLYIISAPNNVFKVNTQTRVAKYVAAISNLPKHFTANGAVVNEDGTLLVSSAVDNNAYYIVDPKTWSAKPFTVAQDIYRSSDLANSNYLCTYQPPKEVTTLTMPAEKFTKNISVYPNPVTTNSITLQFHKVPTGKYSIELIDVLGRQVQHKRVSISADNQTETMNINSSYARGTYMIKVTDWTKQSVYSQKVLVQNTNN